MILLTGASGFLGQHLIRRLSAGGAVVRALYHHTPPAAHLAALPGVHWVQCDLLDVFAVEEVFDGVEEVYHCAAIVSFDPSKKEELIHLNVEGTANVVDAALEAGVRKMIAISSVAALGRAAQEGSLITENADWEESSRNSAYGISKYYAEMEVWRGIGEGLDAVVLNPGIILGEGDWSKGSAKLMKVVDDEFSYYTAGVNAWVDVQDVVSAAIALMQSAITAERYILSAGNFAYFDIFSKMAASLSKKPPRIRASPFVTNLVARWSLFKSRIGKTEPTITPETARTAQAQCFYDNSKLLSALPAFRYTPIEDTVQRMAQAYLAGKPE